MTAYVPKLAGHVLVPELPGHAPRTIDLEKSTQTQ